jgi:hypothetical protein
MWWKTKLNLIFLLSFFIFHISPLQAQPSFGGEYMLVQYVQEDNGHRSVMHFQLIADGDTSGTYKELFREQGEPDSGSFSYFLNEDRTFIIPEEEGQNHGIVDDQADVFSLVRSDSGFALYGVGIRKSSGKTVADLSGEYWVSEFLNEGNFQAVGINSVNFDGAGKATLYRLENTVGEIDTIQLIYLVDDDGMILLDSFLIGMLSPDGQFFVAAMSDYTENIYVMGIKKSSGLDSHVLQGSYIYNQVRTSNEGPDAESNFYSRVNFDGEGNGELVMFLGEPYNEHLEYTVQADGFLDIDSALGAVSTDRRYFLNIDLGDTTSVAFGLGIRGVDLSLSIENNLSIQNPSFFVLKQNYPNPFNPSTIINYELPITNDVELSIYNLLGQKIVTLVSGRQQAGTYNVEWNASVFASGIYIYRLQSGTGFVQTRKLVLVK